jgi:hypothetical protein
MPTFWPCKHVRTKKPNHIIFCLASGAIVLLLRSGHAQASAGNSHPAYQDCLLRCRESGCVYRVNSSHSADEACDTICNGSTDFWLRMLGWDCEVLFTARSEKHRLQSMPPLEAMDACMNNGIK